MPRPSTDHRRPDHRTHPSRRSVLTQAGAAMLAGALPASARAAGLSPAPLPRLLELGTAWGQPHDAHPQGVPAGYDWARRARLGRGHAVPEGFGAMTAWGQVFWADDAAAGDAMLAVRDLQLLVCSGPDRRWTRLQAGAIEGRVFRPDFRGNEARAATTFVQRDGVAQVRFPRATAFHFWPRQGRVRVPAGALHGLVVLIEARLVPLDDGRASTPGALLLGAGADYWSSGGAAWDQYKTNRDAGVGRLERVTDAWRWFGLSTAAAADLHALSRQDTPR